MIPGIFLFLWENRALLFPDVSPPMKKNLWKYYMCMKSQLKHLLQLCAVAQTVNTK